MNTRTSDDLQILAPAARRAERLLPDGAGLPPGQAKSLVLSSSGVLALIQFALCCNLCAVLFRACGRGQT